ncbi:MAG: hypothetical protein M3Z75_16420 [Actinomycetota bacterium]|nr:hypothetical protein [Actinomycetota bacterium]
MARPTKPASPAALARKWSAYLRAAVDTVPPGTSVFGLKDNLGQPMDCLRVIALQPGSYLGVYQVGVGNDFAVDLAVSSNLRTWRELQTLQPNASQPDLAAAGGGFLLATEASASAASPAGNHAHYVDVQYYPSVATLMLGQAARTLVLPHRLAKPESGVEGTPVIKAVDLSAGLDDSTITISFHYLSPGLVDREGIGVLTDFSTWSAQEDEPLDSALIQAGLNGKHGDRAFAPGTGDDLELVEAQRNSVAPWEVYLYNRPANAVTSLHIKTPKASRSFANPFMACVPDPAGANVAVVTLFLPNQQVGPGEAGELLYDQPSPLCAH